MAVCRPLDLSDWTNHSTCTAVGIIIGFIFGATNIIRFGPGPNGMLRTLGQYMLGSAATFGCAREADRYGDRDLTTAGSSCQSERPFEQRVRLSQRRHFEEPRPTMDGLWSFQGDGLVALKRRSNEGIRRLYKTLWEGPDSGSSKTWRGSLSCGSV